MSKDASQLPVICLMGPTASGKTGLAIDLVQKYPFEIISVDSAMVYRGMDIGTAKPTAEELALAPHRLIDICDPSDSYSAGQFCLDVKEHIADIHKHNKIPLLVGGTMLYFTMLQKGFSEFPGADLKVRQQIAEEAEQLGWPKMHEKLRDIDPDAAGQLHPNDAQRIHRALEIFHSTGKTLTANKKEQHWDISPFSFVNIILAPEYRAIVHQRIEQRFDAMLVQGFVEEVKGLYDRGDLSADLSSLRAVGYRQAWSYLSGEYDLATMREKAIIATRQFAKRQYTWLRRWENAHQFFSGDVKLMSKAVELLKRVLSL
jgi:tRNA dimethylallyltransferase